MTERSSRAAITPPPSLAAMGEFGFISRIAASVRNGSGVVTGIGDDAAVTMPSPGMQLLTSSDMLLEDVHFRRSWHDPLLLGRKSLAVNLSDIAAMGGIPRWTTLSLAVPCDLSLDFLDSFISGFLAMASEYGVTLVGGDTCSSRSGLAISVTIMGEQSPECILRRSGARPGDEIWVTGTLGDAAMGLRLLEQQPTVLSGGDFRANSLLSRLLDPIPRLQAGAALAESRLVSAMIDISDGLAADFAHIAELSGTGGELRLADLPLSPAFLAALAAPGEALVDLALCGGEDYELCFTAPRLHREKIFEVIKMCGIDAIPVGIVTDSPGIVVRRASGSTWSPGAPGFNHFA